MLERLLETGAQRRKSGWGGTASVIVHGAIIGLAIVATANAKPPREHDDGPTMIPLAPPVADAPAGPKHASGSGATATTAARTLPSVPVPGPVDIDVAVPPTVGEIGAAADALSEIAGPSGGAGGPSGPASGVTSDGVVDSPVRAISERRPLYPETLRVAGIAGAVTMQFVIDTLGRVEPASLRVIASSHELFTRAVVASLRQARFTSGEVAGRRVRTLVERSFRFDIAGPR